MKFAFTNPTFSKEIFLKKKLKNLERITKYYNFVIDNLNFK